MCGRCGRREPETGDLIIVGDGSQSLYRKRDFTWADAGIHASGRVINRKFDLDRNYRNTAEVLRAARPFSMRSAGRMRDMPPLPIDPETAVRSGSEPWLIKLNDAADELHYAASLIDALFAQFPVQGITVRVRKETPVLDGIVDAVGVELTRERPA